MNNALMDVAVGLVSGAIKVVDLSVTLKSDTPILQLPEEFGWKIFKLVVELTDVTKPEDGNRATRKAIEAKRLGMASKEAQTIKLADLIDNTKTIFKHDPKFAKVYKQEKIALLEAMDKVHGTDLYMKANLQLQEMYD